MADGVDMVDMVDVVDRAMSVKRQSTEEYEIRFARYCEGGF